MFRSSVFGFIYEDVKFFSTDFSVQFVVDADYRGL